MKKFLLIALSTFAVSANAWEPELYTGANLASWQYTQTGFPMNFNVTAVEGLAGIGVLPYLAVEARVGAGITAGRDNWESYDEDTEEWFISDTFEIRVRHYASIYLRPKIENEKASLYGLIGLTTLDLDTDTGGSSSDTDATFGFGVSFVMTPNVNITAEWRKLINAENFNLRGGSVGFTYSF